MKTYIWLVITAAILAAAFFVSSPPVSADIGQSLRELFPGGSSGEASKKIRAEAKDFDLTPIADEEGFYHIEAPPGTIMGGQIGFGAARFGAGQIQQRVRQPLAFIFSYIEACELTMGSCS